MSQQQDDVTLFATDVTGKIHNTTTTTTTTLNNWNIREKTQIL